MKTIGYFAFLTVAALVALAPAPARAQFTNSGSSYNQNEAAAAFDASSTADPARSASSGTTEFAVESLLRPGGALAGTDMKDMKNVPSIPSAGGESDGFSAPTAYAEYKYQRIQDNRQIGFDGPQQNGTVGFDFESFYKTVVGFNFTYTNEDLSTSGAGSNFTNKSDSYFFSTYAANNFWDWMNVGASFTYGRTDTQFNVYTGDFPQAAGSTDAGLDAQQDNFGLSPFIGIAHTYGAISFSDTAAYIWAYDHFSFESPTANGAPTGAIPAGDAKTLNQTFLLLNNVQYAIDDKWAVSVQANYTRLLTQQSIPVAGVPLAKTGNQWVSLGAKADYTFSKRGDVFLQFEHDILDTTFDDYRIRTGVNINF